MKYSNFGSITKHADSRTFRQYPKIKKLRTLTELLETSR